MTHDIEATQVLLDKAESRGMMGYPDVLGKAVRVDCGADSQLGTVTAVGPLGFTLLWETAQREYHRSVLSDAPRHRTYRRFYPWSLATITVTEETDEADLATGGER